MNEPLTYLDLNEIRGLTGSELSDWLAEHIRLKHLNHDDQAARERADRLEEEQKSWDAAVPQRQAFAKFGSARSRYVPDEEVPWREEIAHQLEVYAALYDGYQALTGNNRFAKKAAYLRRQASRFRQCGYEYVKLRCRECNRTFLGASRCESKLCKHCARKHGARIRERQMNLVKSLPSDRKHRLGFLTLTKVVNPERSPNDHDIKAVAKAARKLINRSYPKKFGCGAFAVIEIGENNNIHVHALVYGPYIPQQTLSQEWQSLTGDSYVVDIRSVSSGLKLVNYLLKYISKPPDYKDPAKYAQFLDSLAGVRRVHTFGVFYGTPLLLKASCPCPLCGGKFQYMGTDGGANLPVDALLLSETQSFKVIE